MCFPHHAAPHAAKAAAAAEVRRQEIPHASSLSALEVVNGTVTHETDMASNTALERTRSSSRLCLARPCAACCSTLGILRNSVRSVRTLDGK